jgi:hypothetical protein
MIRSQPRLVHETHPRKKKPITKKGWWSGSNVGPEFKPQYRKKKNAS